LGTNRPWGGRIPLLPNGAGPEASTPARAWLSHARAEAAGGEGWATAAQEKSHEPPYANAQCRARISVLPFSPGEAPNDSVQLQIGGRRGGGRSATAFMHHSEVRLRAMLPEFSGRTCRPIRTIIGTEVGGIWRG
jgi:hypothetical protein